ncbi:MAG: PDZ domain-containing protein [Chitinivibrionales bacterium]|nr:PDZ domain-containing protein [Chitinivibrionales bacterium]
MNSETTTSLFTKPRIIGTVILTVVISGLLIDNIKADSDNFYSDIIRLDDVATKIHQGYVEEVDSKRLVNEAIEGMLTILDPHTTYFEKKQYDELRIHTEGKFGGLGIQISIRDNVLTVMTPISGTPASRAGIQSGDQIIEIEGESTKGIKLDEAVNKLRGEPNTDVAIKIRRKGEPKPLEYTITREIIQIKSVPYYGVFNDSIGYIRLNTFSQEAGKEIEKAIKLLLKKGINGLVLDLRHNPGGLLPQAIEVASKFLPRKSLVVSTRGRSPGQNKEFEAPSNPVLPEDMKLAILVNYASASASEIVAGAIQDWDRGVILGDTTFGKGSVQSILPLEDQSHHIKLTTAFYYTPSGRCINKPENDIQGDKDVESEFNHEEGIQEENGDTDEKSETPRDTATYKTKNGRLVYGGGGIIPDTVVIPEIPKLLVRVLFRNDVFFKFANREHPKVKMDDMQIDSSFNLNKKIMNDFYTFIDSIDFEYKTVAGLAFDDFEVRTGLVEDTADSDSVERNVEEMELSKEDKKKLQEAAHIINDVLKRQRKEEFSNQEDEIKKHITEAFLIREYGQDHEIVYRHKLADDEQLQTAMQLLSNPDPYKTLLQPQVQEKE